MICSAFSIDRWMRSRYHMLVYDFIKFTKAVIFLSLAANFLFIRSHKITPTFSVVMEIRATKISLTLELMVYVVWHSLVLFLRTL